MYKQINKYRQETHCLAIKRQENLHETQTNKAHSKGIMSNIRGLV